MKETQITVPDLGMIAGTRAILGLGLGLLLADFIPKSQRRVAGWTLFTVGALTTVPLVWKVFGHPRTFTLVNECENEANKEGSQYSEHFNGRTEFAAG